MNTKRYYWVNSGRDEKGNESHFVGHHDSFVVLYGYPWLHGSPKDFWVARYDNPGRVLHQSIDEGAVEICRFEFVPYRGNPNNRKKKRKHDNDEYMRTRKLAEEVVRVLNGGMVHERERMLTKLGLRA